MVNRIYKLNLFAILLAAVVVILGAYTRLTDAGLGCPDWPGCYGFLSVPTQAEEISIAEQAFPERPVEPEKAWNEMVHRYFAGGLGLLIAALFFMSLRAKQKMALPTILLVTVCFQAVLGMWTVTMNLMPLVVMGHLLGGFTTFCLLVLMAVKNREQLGKSDILSKPSSLCHQLYGIARIAFLLLVIQIALGGWTAANYAAVACSQLPICEGDWVNRLDFEQAFSIPTGHADYEFGVFPFEARMTIHIMHRLGAIFVLGAFIWLSVTLLKSKSIVLKRYGVRLGTLVSLQFLLGISNVTFNLPLAVAVSHNFVALCMLAVLVALLYNLSVQDKTQASFNTWIKD